MYPHYQFGLTSMVKVESGHSDDVPEEEFVPDHRAGLQPSEVVQSKLMTLMHGMPVPVSCMHVVRGIRRADSTRV
jgi:hypothetical protein